jgi:hypothetical protein
LANSDFNNDVIFAEQRETPLQIVKVGLFEQIVTQEPMSVVAIVGCDASRFAHDFLRHQEQDDGASTLHLHTKYYSVSLSVRSCDVADLSAAFDFGANLGFASADELARDCDALFVLVRADRLLDNVPALSAFVAQRLLDVHRPSIVACVDLCTDVAALRRLADDDAFREWLGEHEIEYITMQAVDEHTDDGADAGPADVFGFDRVREVLAAHMWRDLKRHDKAAVAPVAAAAAPAAPAAPTAASAQEDADETDIEKFEEALKAISAHRRTDGTAVAPGDDAAAATAEEETSEQRQVRLANAERMMAAFLSGVGLKFADV